MTTETQSCATRFLSLQAQLIAVLALAAVVITSAHAQPPATCRADNRTTG
jgi:hypothetical protein